MSQLRFPTKEELSFLTNFLKPLPGLPSSIAKAVAKNQRQELRRQLQDVQIYPEILPELKKQLEVEYLRAQVDPGKSVGALASTSIGERNTQGSLSSFHTAGQQKMNLLLGVPRLQEIVNVTRDIKTPSMEIHLDYSPELLQNLSFVREKALQILEYREINNFLADYDFIENREIDQDEESWYELHRTFIGTEYEECSWSIRLKFDVDLLYGKRMNLSRIAETIHANYAEAFCVISPDSVGIIDVYVNTKNVGDMEGVIESLRSAKRKGHQNTESVENLRFLITDENRVYYFLRDIVIPSIRYLPISGIEKIRRCFFQEKDGKWYIVTDGSNLKAVMSHPEIDGYQTKTNHLWDTFECLGIEATRAMLRRELDKLISVSHRHIDLLINSMTYAGKPTPASSRGIDIRQVGLLAKISFETIWTHLFKAVIGTERDDMRGVSSAIIAGNVPLLGSGVVQLINDKSSRRKLESEIADRLNVSKETKSSWDSILAESDLLIDEDKEAYKQNQKMSSSKPFISEREFNTRGSARPLNSSLISYGGKNEVPPGNRQKKSNLNMRIDPPPFSPLAELQFSGNRSRLIGKNAGTRSTPSFGTRIMMLPESLSDIDKTSKMEIQRLGKNNTDLCGIVSEHTGKKLEDISEEQEIY
jgi:hypothetical protein